MVITMFWIKRVIPLLTLVALAACGAPASSVPAAPHWYSAMTHCSMWARTPVVSPYRCPATFGMLPRCTSAAAMLHILRTKLIAHEIQNVSWVEAAWEDMVLPSSAIRNRRRGHSRRIDVLQGHVHHQAWVAIGGERDKRTTDQRSVGPSAAGAMWEPR
jgi:hypothetical protein